MVEDAYVLCEDGRIAAVGRDARSRRRSTGEVEELDGRGLCAVPGLVDCHTHACFAGDRVEEFALRAAGATLRGAARGGRRHPLDRPGDACGRRGGARRRRRAGTAAGCSAPGTTTFEAKSGYGLDRDTELAQLRAIAAAGGVPTWLGAHAVPPEFPDADAYLDFALAEVLPEAARARRGRGRLPRARCLRRRAGAAVPHRLPRRRARAPARTATSSPSRARSRSPSSSAPARSTTSRRPATTASAALAASEVVGRPPAGERALPRPADAARAGARRRGRGGRARDRLQPRQRVLREPAARLLARGDAAGALAGGGARAPARSTRPTSSAAPTGRAASRRATTPTSSCSTPPTGATSRTTSADDHVAEVIVGGARRS